MDTTILEDLGLTTAEINVYVTLLELGSASAGHILDKSGAQNSVMHRALNSLIEKGLIHYIMEGRKKIYQATKPETFFEFIETKKKRFEKLLPELKQKEKFALTQEMATIYRGIRGVNEVYRQLREAKGKEYLSFGGGRQCEERMGTAWWQNHHLNRIYLKLRSRQVFDETVRVFGTNLVKDKMSRVRYLPATFAQFQETVIVGSLVAITIFTEKPYSILFEDTLVAEGYRKHFELLWDAAKK